MILITAQQVWPQLYAPEIHNEAPVISEPVSPTNRLRYNDQIYPKLTHLYRACALSYEVVTSLGSHSVAEQPLKSPDILIFSFRTSMS